ncbi:hypothetical protein RG47T_0681 [Mucilaginibacter polytrichastri]|uniref:Uncharacterized protein n=1 Tax=Mucilaginibacter polytrichastri TaxID=1302689 RepID=A0A1Q5ZTZ8_9SPHI|nr:hypothetical protein RG47T_0681 [Mucilaginibacter polytrichastri]
MTPVKLNFFHVVFTSSVFGYLNVSSVVLLHAVMQHAISSDKIAFFIYVRIWVKK